MSIVSVSEPNNISFFISIFVGIDHLGIEIELGKRNTILDLGRCTGLSAGAHDRAWDLVIIHDHLIGIVDKNEMKNRNT